MKIKWIQKNVTREEILDKGFVCRVHFNNINLFNLEGLLENVSVQKSEIPIGEDQKLLIKLIDAPFLLQTYKAFNGFEGMKIVEFQNGDTKVEIEW